MSQRWIEEEKEQLRQNYTKAGKGKLLSSFPNRTHRAIRAEAGKLDLCRKKESPWSKDEIILLQNNRDKLSAQQLQKVLPDRSINAIRLKAERLKFHYDYYWTDREIEILKIHYPYRNKDQMLLLLPDRSWEGIQQRAYKLNLKGIDYIGARIIRLNNFNKCKEFQEKRLKALCRKPTKPEQILMDIMTEHKLPYKYVGDGSFIIEGLNPDFVNINGKKHIIEVFGRIWHETLLKESDWKRSELGRIMIFNSYGYKTLIIWDDELRDKGLVINRIKQFDRKK